MIRPLWPFEHDLYVQHLLDLPKQDRWFRFSHAAGDEWIRTYVDDLRPDDVVMAIFDQGKVVAAAHFAAGPDFAEIGVSVSLHHRNQGYGTKLLLKGKDWALDQGKRRIYTLCQADNRAMLSLARKMGMQIERDSGTAEAYLALPRPPDAGSNMQQTLFNPR